MLLTTGWAASASASASDDKIAKESSAISASSSNDNWLPRGGGGDDHDDPLTKTQLQPPKPTTISGGGAPTVTADYSSDFEMTPSEVRVAAGTSAYLSCRPRSLRNKTVRPLLLFIFTLRQSNNNFVPVLMVYSYSTSGGREGGRAAKIQLRQKALSHSIFKVLTFKSCYHHPPPHCCRKMEELGQLREEREEQAL